MKILRFLLSNQETCVTLEDVAIHTKVGKPSVRKEFALFKKIKLIKEQTCTREVEKGRGKIKKKVKRRFAGFIVNQKFEHLFALRNFILNIAPTDERGIMKRLRGTGRIKLVIISGAFIQDPDSRVDILVVGDALKDVRLKSAIRDLEAHMGRELRFTAFTTPDFLYRLGMYDRLIRDVLDYPHQIVVDRLGAAWKDVSMRKNREK